VSQVRKVTESELILDFSDIEFFQLGKLKTYTKLNNQSLKEVDFIFLHNHKLYFLEVKSFMHPLRQPKPDEVKDLTADLIQKSKDALLLMSTVWVKSQIGQKLRQDGIPAVFSDFQSFTIIHGLDLPPDLYTHFGTLNSEVTAALRLHGHLFDFQVVLLTYEDLLKRFPFIQRQTN
jgi:hypothetical protein